MIKINIPSTAVQQAKQEEQPEQQASTASAAQPTLSQPTATAQPSIKLNPALPQTEIIRTLATAQKQGEIEAQHSQLKAAQQTTAPAAVATPVLNQSSGAIPAASKASAAICERIDQLQLDLMQANPNISENLRIIHRNLLEDPAQVTLLTTEQRAIFFQGLMKQTVTVITAAASKTRQSSKKEFKAMTVDDLL